MANYAAVLSLIHTLNHINTHPRPPISLHQSHLDSLTQNLTFFQHFLESYPTQEDDDLESRIAAAAYAAEDLIENHIVDQIHGISNIMTRVDLGHRPHRMMVLIKKKVRKMMGAQTADPVRAGFYRGLQRVIKEMDLIKTEVMEIIQQKEIVTLTSHLSSGAPASSTWQSSTKPMFDDAFVIEVLDKLTGQQSGLQIIPIVGMGGIGKTTFASTIYSHPLIVERFDIMAWVTISQEYSRGNVLKLLCQQIKGGVNDLSEDEMGSILYKHLCGERYLIVMDDVWSVEALDEVKSFFPDNNDGSRIMITTRLSNLNFMLSGSPDIQMQVLDEDKSWNLLCKTVFGELDCPVELKHIGKEIAKNCRGLPLSIAVIGGLLIKSRGARAHWEYILQNLSSLINLEADEYCQQLLLRSYKELPIHLKPCFLYMGVFPEDFEINVSHVIKLWISEGILKPNDGKSLEEVAAEYLKELIDRSLIMVHELRWNGEAKKCKIHDLLRDVCVREAEKEKFLCVLRQQKHQSPQDTHVECRICVFNEEPMEIYSPESLHAVESASLTRSFLYSVHDYWNQSSRFPFVGDESPSPRFPLLRVHSSVTKRSEVPTASNNAVFEQANLRYVCLNLTLDDARSRLSSLCSLLWNVQTLKVKSKYYPDTLNASKIWGMPLLRHVMLTECVLPDGEDKFVLENLHTLSCIHNFIFSEEAIKRIPNVKKLKVEYMRTEDNEDEGLPNFCLNNLGRLRKLESFSLEAVFPDSCGRKYFPKNLVCFPHSLKKLTLRCTRLNWEDLNIRVGTLPLLQFLRLDRNACVGPTWETVEGKFCRLRVLFIFDCDDLKNWDTHNTDFPCLERLSLNYLKKLKEIPLSIGDISPLTLIKVGWCSKSVTDSAKRIKKEQLENGNEDLQLKIFAVGYEGAVFEEDEKDNQTDWDEDQVYSDEDLGPATECEDEEDNEDYQTDSDDDQVVGRWWEFFEKW